VNKDKVVVAALEKVRHTSKNTPYLEKCTTLEKVRHTAKNTSYLEKCATFEKKCGALGKMRRT